MRTNRQWIARRWTRAFRGARLDSLEDSASGRGFLFRNERLVSGSVHQAGDLGGIGELDFNQPCGAMRVGVDGFRSIRERSVRLEDFSGHGGVKFADRLDGFDRAKQFSRRNFRAHRWQFDKHDIAELMLRVVGNSDRARAAGNFDPLMFLGVTIVAWIHNGSLEIRPLEFLRIGSLSSTSLSDIDSMSWQLHFVDAMVSVAPASRRLFLRQDGQDAGATSARCRIGPA